MPSSVDLKVEPFADALQKLSPRTPIGAKLRSDEWAKVPLALRERAFFSARVESVRLLQGMKDSILGALNGSRTEGGAGMDRGRFISDMRKLAGELGVGQLGKSTITDVSGPERLNLIYDMQTRNARGFARFKFGNDPYVLQEWPAQRLIRVATRKEPRDWEDRWNQAAANVAFEGVSPTRMVALKSSPIWGELSSFGTPWPPFDYGSGMGVEDVDRGEAEALGLVAPGEILPPSLEDDFNAKLESSVKGLDPAFADQLREIGFVIDGDKIKPAPPIEPAKVEPAKVEPVKVDPVPPAEPKAKRTRKPKAAPEAPKVLAPQVKALADIAQSLGFKPKLIARIEAIPEPVVKKLPQMPQMFRDRNGRGAYYAPSSHTIVMPVGTGGWSGSPTVFDHEFGHAVHHGLNIITNNHLDDDLRVAMESDIAAWKKRQEDEFGIAWGEKFKPAKAHQMMNDHIKKHNLGDAYDAKRDLPGAHRAIGFVDTIGGMTGGSYGYGHGINYYRSTNGGAKEAFANIYRAIINGWDEYEKEFPLTTKFIRQKLDL